MHKTGIRGIQDTRQIVNGKTNDIENDSKEKVGPEFLKKDNTRKKQFDIHR